MGFSGGPKAWAELASAQGRLCLVNVGAIELFLKQSDDFFEGGDFEPMDLLGLRLFDKDYVRCCLHRKVSRVSVRKPRGVYSWNRTELAVEVGRRGCGLQERGRRHWRWAFEVWFTSVCGVGVFREGDEIGRREIGLVWDLFTGKPFMFLCKLPRTGIVLSFGVSVKG